LDRRYRFWNFYPYVICFVCPGWYSIKKCHPR
jgi:hypothetical protein